MSQCLRPSPATSMCRLLGARSWGRAAARRATWGLRTASLVRESAMGEMPHVLRVSTAGGAEDCVDHLSDAVCVGCVHGCPWTDRAAVDHRRGDGVPLARAGRPSPPWSSGAVGRLACGGAPPLLSSDGKGVADGRQAWARARLAARASVLGRRSRRRRPWPGLALQVWAPRRWVWPIMLRMWRPCHYCSDHTGSRGG